MKKSFNEFWSSVFIYMK